MESLSDVLAAVPAAASGACVALSPRLQTLQGVAHVVSALSCLVILAAAVAFLRRRGGLAPVARGLGAVFVAFLFAGFLTQAVLLASLWRPVCTPQVAVTLLTALVWLLAAVVAWPQLPPLLALPSPGELARSNAALARTNASLETTIARRTRELEQANQRFELALSRSNITVYAQDADLRYTWIHNPRPGLTPASVEDAEAGSFVEAPETRALKREVLATGRTAGSPVVTGNAKGLHYFDLTVTPTRGTGAAIDGLLCTAIDVTERRLFDVRLATMTAQVTNAYRRFELALEDSPITVFEQDPRLRYTFVQNPPPGTEVDDFLGRTDPEVFVAADLDGFLAAKRRAIETGARGKVEVELEVGGTRRFYDVRLEPRTATSGEVLGIIGTAVDLTERRRSEQHMRLVMRELTHRSKNLLAVVQAMARKTASMAPDADTFVRDFSARLRAIAAAHDLLVAESWSGAELRDLFVASLSQTVDPAEVNLGGPPLKLSPDAAQMLGLAFHELTMNAIRFGALSVAGGRISVDWRRDGDEVRICWREDGGPSIEPPSRSGFGRLLLERLVGASLGGSVSLDFRRNGLVCQLVFPTERLIAA